MKTLENIVSGRKDFPIFEGANEQILEWVDINLTDFDLEEYWSCTVSLIGNTITINGDEDYALYKIIEVQSIQLPSSGREAIKTFFDALNKIWDKEPETLIELGLTDKVFSNIEKFIK